MVRWYKGFRCSGVSPEAVFNDVQSLVRRYKLQGELSAVRWEKLVGRGNFYFFVAIESEKRGDLPHVISSTLLLLRRLKNPLPNPEGFVLEDIRNMVEREREIVVRDFAPRIDYNPPRRVPDFDPFAIVEPLATSDYALADDIVRTTQAYDQLLLWLSAAGSGTRRVFVNACDVLGLARNGQEAGRIFRRLRILGHIETSRDGSRWSVAPPVLVKRGSVDAAGANYFLCGQRNFSLLQALRRLAQVWEVPQPEGNAPAAAYLRTDDPEELLASLPYSDAWPYLRDGGEAALQLAWALPAIAEWPLTLEVVAGVDPHMSNLKWFNGADFVDTFFDGSGGLYEFWPLADHQPQNAQPMLSLFYDVGRRLWLRGEWYGLRFLALQATGLNCLARFSEESNQLAIPINCRWPELYERALVLASGLLPTIKRNWLVYEGINLRLIEVLGQKLNLHVEGSRAHA
jgi:hypothetical protein